MIGRENRLNAGRKKAELRDAIEPKEEKDTAGTLPEGHEPHGKIHLELNHFHYYKS